MTSPVVQFENVSKRFFLGRRRAFIRELLPDILVRQIGDRSQDLWALEDVSFNILPGEVFGIIGDNGSGKTTLLSLLAGITTPTRGCFTTKGRIGALIQLGAGFHPELTGRENVYLNASILGIKSAQVDQVYDRIVEFAEIGPFMETPVKRYSSGMFARLGFSVAAHFDPDILLVDEVLAVGDMAFQSKCLQRMRDFVREGRSVLFVSHNMNMVQGLCRNVLWLEHGKIKKIGPSSETISAYLEEMDRRFLLSSAEDLRREDAGTGDIRIERLVLRNDEGVEKSEFQSGESLKVDLYYDATRRIARPYFWIAISSRHGALFMANMLLDGLRPDSVEGRGSLTCTFKSLPLLPQVYTVSAGIRDHDGTALLVRSRRYAIFRIAGNSKEIGLESEVAESLARDSAPILVPYEWRMPDGQIRVVNFSED